VNQYIPIGGRPIDWKPIVGDGGAACIDGKPGFGRPIVIGGGGSGNVDPDGCVRVVRLEID
jgi:hypothetical protein